MKIWIDITNSPHVLFFRPIIKKLKEENHRIIITAREHSQTIDLLNLFKIKHKKIGKHAGKSIFLKAIYAFIRCFQLVKELRNKKIDLVIVHQSPYGMITGWFLNIKKRIYIFDNETAWLQNFLGSLFATKVICPEVITQRNFFGKSLIKYPGIKEAVYLSDFKPNPKVLKELNLSRKKKIIVVRPEPWTAAYYKKKKNVLIPLIKDVISKTDWQIIIIPRNQEQKREYKNLFWNKVIIPEKAIDAPSLLYYSDLMFGAGGTMNREASVLGVPVISTYQGKLLAVDKWLIDKGYMSYSYSPTFEEIEKVISQKSKKTLINIGVVGLNFLFKNLETVLK